MRLFITIIGLLTLCCPTFAAEHIYVKIAKISEVAAYPERSAPATTVSLNESTISSQLKAIVKTLLVRVGDVVEKDAVLAQLDCTDYRLARRKSVVKLASIQARHDLAERNLQRTRLLTVQHSVTEEILDERESTYSMLSADLEDAQITLEMKQLDESRCQILSPFRALVLKHSSAAGELVNVGTALMQILDVSDMELSAQVLHRDIEQLKKTNELYFVHDTIRYAVHLRTVVGAVDTQTRNREVRLLFNDETALPGATGSLIWRDQRAHIPHHLLVRRDGKLGVFTVVGERVKFNPMPQAQAGYANITTLDDDAEIVIEGQFALTEKATVAITN